SKLMRLVCAPTSDGRREGIARTGGAVPSSDASRTRSFRLGFGSFAACFARAGPRARTRVRKWLRSRATILARLSRPRLVPERGGAEFSYQKYLCDHTWSFDGGHKMTATAAPTYLGNPANVDPEEAFVASLASCHMLTFLSIACKQKFVLDSYEDE